MAPIIFVLLFPSTTNKMNKRHQSKNSKDSYKLLNGKYPARSHLKPKMVNKSKFEDNTPTQHKFFRTFNFGYLMESQ
jgi:hypothetical protein